MKEHRRKAIGDIDGITVYGQYYDEDSSITALSDTYSQLLARENSTFDGFSLGPGLCRMDDLCTIVAVSMRW